MEVAFTVPQTAERVSDLSRRWRFSAKVSGQHQEYLRLTENICGLVRKSWQENISRTDVSDCRFIKNLTLYPMPYECYRAPRAVRTSGCVLSKMSESDRCTHDPELNAEFAYLTGRYLPARR